MPVKNAERALHTLTGEVHALFLAVQVLAKTHQNPSAMASELDIAAQRGLAGLEPHPIDDAVIVRYQDAIAGIQRALAANPLHK
jgi:hypothetical protein